MLYRFDVRVDLPDLHLRAGDSVTYDPANAAEPFFVHRPARLDPGALLAALNDGAVEGVIPPQLVTVAAPRSPERVLRLLPRRGTRTG